MTYAALMDRLLGETLNRGIKLGLSNMEQLDQALGHPHKRFSSIHVAGTNGKGSVVTKIAKGLELEDYRVGAYTSPHLTCYRERIRVNGHMITESEVEELLPVIFEFADAYQISATFFEVTTLLAFCYFAKQEVDYAVVETGLGGRLDATNIMTPLLSIITSISLDHQQILGDTIAAIAAEKAGIIKPGVPVIIGPHVPLTIIAPIVKERESRWIQIEGEYAFFDEENGAIAKRALQVLQVSPTNIEKAIRVRPKCRFEVVHGPNTMIFDVAHNPDALRALFAAIHREFPGKKFRLILGLSKEKDALACLEVIKRETCHLHLVSPSSERCLPVQTLLEKAQQVGYPQHLLHPEKELVTRPFLALESGLIIVTGSFYSMEGLHKRVRIWSQDT